MVDRPPALCPETLAGLRRVHVVGVGGAGMSGIARILAEMGHVVTGTDRRDSAVLQRLRRQGIPVSVGHDPVNVVGVDLVSASSAVPATNPELVEAARLGIPVVRRAETLAAICATRRTVAVAGTKGKSTTTAMVAHILTAAGWDPSFLVGGDLPGADGGTRWVASSPWFVVEADESDGTFLGLPVEAAVVTNVEQDHLDFYGSMDALVSAFAAFLDAAEGPRVVGVDSAASMALVAGRPALTTYGTSPTADVRILRVDTGRNGARFEVDLGLGLGRAAGRLTVELPVPGLHNVRNAAGALALTARLGVTPAVAVEALVSYRAVARRFEWRGEREGVTFIDDYAHVPSAVAATLETARAGGWERLVAVFQPHLYSRTQALGEAIGTALAAADVVVVTDVYAAREAPLPGVDGSIVARAARQAGPAGLPVIYVPERAALAAAVASVLRPGDLCLTIGAGDVTGLTDELLAGPGR